MPDFIVTIGWYITLWYVRFCHGGKVISGDYCSSDCGSKQGYQVGTGGFFLGWSIFITLIVLATCLSQVKPEVDRARGKAVATHADYEAEYEPVEPKAFASGGCGAAWKVKKRNSDDTTIYMGKVFSGDATTVKATFEPEARAFEKLNHPNCVRHIKTYGDGMNGDAIVMELIDGMDFNRAIFKKRMFKDGLPKDVLLDILI